MPWPTVSGMFASRRRATNASGGAGASRRVRFVAGSKLIEPFSSTSLSNRSAGG